MKTQWQTASKLLLFWGCVLLASAQATAATSSTVAIWSDGARLQGTLHVPENLTPGAKLPGILLVHGWGGHRGNLDRAYAPQLAELGFLVLTFDFRSWGTSDGFLLADDSLPLADKMAPVTVDGQHVRHIVNPLKMIDDARAALSYLVGEPNVQADNIGVWGTSLGGGVALVTAANDSRVKALVSQIGAVDNKANWSMVPASEVPKWETLRARGEITPYPGPESGTPGLKGFPDMIAMLNYDPAAYWDDINVATLVIDARDEELFDRKKNGQALYDSVRDRVPAEYLVLPGKHYDIYRDEGYRQALQAAQQWFVKYLQEKKT